MGQNQIVVVANASNLLTVYSSIFVYQPFCCQSGFRVVIPFEEYKTFVSRIGESNLFTKIFSKNEAIRYDGLYKLCKQNESLAKAELLFRFYYINDILRLSSSEIRRAYARGAHPTWFVGDFGSNLEIESDELLEYALKGLKRLRTNPGCQQKMNEIKDLLLLKSDSISLYRAYAFYALIALWDVNAPKVKF